MEYPKLRDIEAFPVSTSTGEMICLRDGLGYCSAQVAVSPHAFFILSRFDGKHTVRDIQVEYTRQFGEILLSDKIKNIITQMDENFLLESERFEERKILIEEEFKKTQLRLPAHAGGAYPAQKDELYNKIQNLLAFVDKHDFPLPVKGLIAPHIDYSRGEKCYAQSYKILEGTDIDLFVIFGTSHMDGDNFFILTDKDFETPLGTVKTEKDIIGSLQKQCDFNLFENEILHKQEHSIELQLPFIQYLFKDAKIIPILCTSFREKIEKGHIPIENERISTFVQAFKKVLKETKKKICFLAGADFSHVGFNFGDQFPLTPKLMKQIEHKDLETISDIEKMDAPSFYNSVRKDEDFRKICGLPPIYALMSVINAQEGRLLNYEQWVDYEINSAVSFSGIGIF